MASQQQPSRPWFRLPSMARPVIDPTPPPAPAAPPPVARPAFRPATQTQETTPATAASDAPAVQRSPPKPGGGAMSVPTSPVVRPPAVSSSLPTSPPAPAVTTTSVPSSPRPRVSAPTSSLPPSPVAPKPESKSPVSTAAAPKPAPSSSVPSSPIPKLVSTTISAPTASPKTAPAIKSPEKSPIPMAVTTAAGGRVPSPTLPTTTIKPTAFRTTTPDSPKPKTTAPPPSPLILPPAKIKSEAESIPLEAEQKRVLVQKTISATDHKPNNGSQSPSEKDTLKSAGIGKKETPKDHAQSKEKTHYKKIGSESEKHGMRVITIAGENRGASMEVIRTPNKKNHVFEGISHNLQKNNGRSGSRSSSSSSSEEDEEERQKKKMEKTMGSGFMSTFMNSNVQGVNNSIVYNSSCSHHDPGVHLALSRKPAAGFKDRRSNGN